MTKPRYIPIAEQDENANTMMNMTMFLNKLMPRFTKFEIPLFLNNNISLIKSQNSEF